jgi:hypothetical protein
MAAHKMNDSNTKKSDAAKSKIPEPDKDIELIQPADLDDIVGGMAENSSVCKTTKIFATPTG